MFHRTDGYHWSLLLAVIVIVTGTRICCSVIPFSDAEPRNWGFASAWTVEGFEQACSCITRLCGILVISESRRQNQQNLAGSVKCMRAAQADTLKINEFMKFRMDPENGWRYWLWIVKSKSLVSVANLFKFQPGYLRFQFGACKLILCRFWTPPEYRHVYNGDG